MLFIVFTLSKIFSHIIIAKLNYTSQKWNGLLLSNLLELVVNNNITSKLLNDNLFIVKTDCN